MAILASSSKYLWNYIPGRSVYVLYQCKSRTLSYRDFFGYSSEDASTSSPPTSSANARLDWHGRLLSESSLVSSAKTRVRFSSRQYAPSVRELLRGLWSLDKDPIWLLVDQLIATGRPHNMTDTCPDFLQWQHVVDAPNFFEAIASLVAQGHILSPKFKEEEEDEDEDDIDDEESDNSHKNSTPTWLAMYLVSAKTDTRTAAHASVAFSLSLIGNTPAPLRIPLLLLTMCALSNHGLKAQVPMVLQAFCDVFTNKDPTLDARDTVIYQYNILLTLISRFPLEPQFATHVDRLLRHMHAYGVPLETTTATQLIIPRRTAPFLVQTLRHILESQKVPPSSGLSVSLTRYFSKSRNQWEAVKYIDGARGIDPLAHARTYLLSFRDVAASLVYLRTVETHHQSISESQDVSDKDFTRGPEQGTSLGSTLGSRLKRRAEPSRTSLVAPPKMRYIYTSMLFAAALSKDVSVDTFVAMTDSVRAAHGADKVLETVALVGLLRRRAWHQARELWKAWEEKSMQLIHTAHETEAFFKRREKAFGDVETVRETLKFTEFESYLLRRSAYRMKVDSTALAVIVRAVAGTNTAGLLDAFELMDGYAIKTVPTPSVGTSDDTQDARFRPHDVRLTSRVLNCFLMRAFGRRRPDVVYRFWESATRYYGVEVSVPTLELLLRSARVAVSMEQTIVTMIPRWLLRGTLRDAVRADAFQDFGEEIRWMLSPECRPGTRWNGLPAWRVARRVFREDFIFANWPWLRDVPVPAQPMMGDAATSRLDALQELSMGDTEVVGVGRYPHLIPRARTFREYVLLLSRVQRSSEIPQVLAWMRALEVRPSRHMLSMCLALWAEVGMGPPADDMWVERYGTDGKLRHGGEYGKLVDWLEEWLGEGEVPNDAEAVASLKYVRELEENERNRY